MMRFSSVLSLPMIGAGVPWGATMPSQPTTSYPGMPASATVGICGAAARRRRPLTARARTLPPSTCGSVTSGSLKAAARLPAMRSFSAGAAPR